MSDEVQWLNPEEMRAWLGYIAASSRLELALDRQMQRDSRMPLAYYLILAMLSEAPDRSLRMGELAEATLSSQSRVSHAVNKLEDRGWVVRESASDDRRSTFARLTDLGKSVLDAAAPGHVAAVREHLIDRLTVEQVRQFEGICARIAEDVELERGRPSRR